jgi:hypothetical protein
MDGLLKGKETGEGFVGKFSEGFLRLVDWDSDTLLEHEFEWVNDYYGAIQRFSASRSSLEDEPLLFGLHELRERTSVAYARLRHAWCSAIDA